MLCLSPACAPRPHRPGCLLRMVLPGPLLGQDGARRRCACVGRVQRWLDLQCTVRCVRVCAKQSSLVSSCGGAVWHLRSLVCGLFLFGPTDLPFLWSLKCQCHDTPPRPQDVVGERDMRKVTRCVWLCTRLKWRDIFVLLLLIRGLDTTVLTVFRDRVTSKRRGEQNVPSKGNVCCLSDLKIGTG